MAAQLPLFADAQADPALAKAEFNTRQAELRTALLRAQYEQLSKEKQSLLIVIAGIDGAGKGATINLINEWMDPRHIRTLAFDRPDTADQTRPPMWRYWDALPPKGKTGIVFGSWYSLLLRETARKRPRTARIERIALAIRRFEAMLAAEGTHILKLWFHLSRNAQSERLKRLLSSEQTAWQVTPNDHKVHKKFDRLCLAGSMSIGLTDRAHAPWHVIPSADDNLRSIRTAERVLDALTRPPARVRPDPQVQPPARVVVTDRLGLPQSAEPTLSKDDYDAQIGLWQGRLAQAVRSDAFKSRALILAFEGQDAAGKGGAIRRIANALDARQYEIHQISAPTTQELARPYLWRFWHRLPRHGRIAVFDRSWYGRVLVERVEKFAAPSAWRRAYGEINDFEAQLAANGVIVLKFWLAIDADEQLARFKAREHSPFKRFKITPDDWRNREKWDAYVRAANEMFARTDTPLAPWHVIATNDKRTARLAVLKHIVLALENAC